MAPPKLVHWPCHWDWCGRSFPTGQALREHFDTVHLPQIKPEPPGLSSQEPEPLPSLPTISSSGNTSVQKSVTKPQRTLVSSAKSLASRGSAPPVMRSADSSARSSLQVPGPSKQPTRQRFNMISSAKTPSPLPIPHSPSVTELLARPGGRSLVSARAPGSPSPQKSTRKRTPAGLISRTRSAKRLKSDALQSQDELQDESPFPPTPPSEPEPLPSPSQLTPDTRMLDLNDRRRSKSPVPGQFLPLFTPTTPIRAPPTKPYQSLSSAGNPVSQPFARLNSQELPDEDDDNEGVPLADVVVPYVLYDDGESSSEAFEDDGYDQLDGSSPFVPNFADGFQTQAPGVDDSQI